MSRNSWENGEGGLEGVAGRLLLLCSVCRMFPGLGEGVKGTSGTHLKLLLTWFLAVPAASRAEGCEWGWAGAQEVLNLMPGDSGKQKRFPGSGG